MVEVKGRAQKENRLTELARAPEELSGLVCGELRKINEE
jgi:hypothetical protein